MFNLDNYMLERLYNIFGGIAILYGSIGYIVSVIFSKIMFDILGIKPILSLIPFYNTYRIYKEYKGRVWKRNWGVAYIITFIIPSGIITGVVLNLMSYKVNNEVVFNFMLLFLVSIIIVFICFLIIKVFGVIMLFIMYLPIFDTKGRRIVLYIQAGFTVLSAFSAFIFQDSSSILRNIVSTVQFLFGIVFLVITFVAATDIRARVRSGKYVLQEKLDYNNLTSYEIDSILKARDRKLVVPVIYNKMDNYPMGDYPYPVNNYPMNNNEEVNRVEYV